MKKTKDQVLLRRIRVAAWLMALLTVLTFTLSACGNPNAATTSSGNTATETRVILDAEGNPELDENGNEKTESKEYHYLENKDDSGILTGVLQFFGKILSWCNFSGNYVLALFLFSLIMQVALCWLGVKQQKNSIGQAKLAPKVSAINKKYAGRNDQATLQKKQAEIQDLYSREGFNPMGGCLPLLIQMPIIMILYYVVIAPMQYILNLSATVATNLQYLLTAAGETLSSRSPQMSIINYFRVNGAEGVNTLRTWVAEHISEGNAACAAAYNDSLTAIEGKLDLLPDFTVGPMDLSATPSFTGNTTVGQWLLLLVPALTFVFLMLTQKLTRKFTYQSPETQDMQNKMSMKIMNWSMPLLSVYFTFMVPAAIGVYWIYRNVLNLCQQMILAKLMPLPKYSEEDYKAAERELMGSSQKKREKRELDPNRPKVRSLHHIDDEGYENGYKIDPNAPAEEEKHDEPAGDVTDNLAAPAPIKNDEKTSFFSKKNKS